MKKISAKATRKTSPTEELPSKTLDADGEEIAANSYLEIQQPLIYQIEEYLQNHPVSGKKMTLKEFCARSGLLMPNMTAIINGTRWAAKSNRESLEKLACILNLPVLQIYILSGFIKPSDVVFSTDIDETVEVIFRTITLDKRLGYRAPSPAVWATWPISAKLHFCMLYEQCVSKMLFRYANIELPEGIDFLA